MTRLQNSAILTSPGTGTASTPASPITQDELEHYRELAAFVREKKALRQDFLDRLAAGATVETGNLILSVRASEERRITKTSLQSIFSSEQIAWINSQIEPMTLTFLTVKEQESILAIDGTI